jgi:uncharacterized protein
VRPVRPVRLVIFAKAPVAGKAKTRLIPKLGAAGAAALAARMLADTLAQARGAAVDAVELCIDPAPDHPDWQGHLPTDVALSGQGVGDLGERLARAARRATEAGERVLLVGTDCPELTRERLGAAAASLRGRDCVIHPARDGGYVLLGLSRFHPSLFTGIAWSGPMVAETTLARAAALGWSVQVGETLHDIDVPADLP